MAEFSESFYEIASEFDRLNSEGKVLNSADFKSDLSDQFNALNRKIPDFSDKISITGEPGNYKLTYDGNELDMKKFNEDFIKSEVNLIDSYKDAGFPASLYNDPDFKKLADDESDILNQNPLRVALRALEQTMRNQAEAMRQIGIEPVSAQDFEDLVKKNKALEEQVKELKDRAKEDGKTGKKTNVGKWIKRAITVIGIASIYEAIKRHQEEMNGCWLVNLSGTDGYKCKVSTLICDSDNLKGTMCTGSDLSGCGTKSNPEQCFEVGKTCVEYNPNSQTCKTKLAQCTSGNCSTYCDCTKIQCPENHMLKCVNVSFWGAAEDFFQQPFDFASSTLKKIFSVLLWVLLGIVVLVVIFFLVKFIINHVRKKREEKND